MKMFQLNTEFRLVGFKPIMVNVLIENVPVSMKLDSGTGIFNFPKELVLLKLSPVKRFPTFLKFMTYNRLVIRQMKTFLLKLSVEKKKKICKLLVIQKGC